MRESKVYALLVAVLTANGELLSNLHFEIDYIGGEKDVWKEFFERADELKDVDVFDSLTSPFARGIGKHGFVYVYRIHRIS